jgi:hypothetical protein
MDHWKAYEAKHGILPADDMNSDQASGSTSGDTTSDQVDDAVLSFGSTSVSAFAKEGSVGDWPGAVAVARAGADKLEDAFSTAQQEVVSDLTSKASAGEEGSVDVPQSTVGRPHVRGRQGSRALLGGPAALDRQGRAGHLRGSIAA